MSKARKKPVEIEFLTFDELKKDYDNFLDGTTIGRQLAYERNSYITKIRYGGNINTLIISTLEGNMKMTNKDYLIVGVRGEIYPCKIDIFNETYDILEER